MDNVNVKWRSLLQGEPHNVHVKDPVRYCQTPSE